MLDHHTVKEKIQGGTSQSLVINLFLLKYQLYFFSFILHNNTNVRAITVLGIQLSFKTKGSGVTKHNGDAEVVL